MRCTSAYVPRNSPLFFSPLSPSLFMQAQVGRRGWPEGRLHKPRESEYGTQERHAQVHRFAERERTKSIARTYAVVYACTRTHPEDTGTGGGGKGRSFQFFLLPSRTAGSRDSRRRIRMGVV